MPYFSQENYHFEIGKILCVIEPEEGGGRPIIFLKPASSILDNDGPIGIPDGRKNLGYAIMLGVSIGRKITKDTKNPMENILGFSIIIDISDIEEIEDSRSSGLPWTMGKGRDTFCPMSEFSPFKEVEDPYACGVYMEINGEEVVSTDTKELVMDIESALHMVSGHMTLYPGDIIAIALKDTQGIVSEGDMIEAGISSIGVLRHRLKGV
jgi:2-keto-4-pentenoate hydratase/2-oxohepta-3-ene-1,7-dioic acid hydratase in catechol pathway